MLDRFALVCRDGKLQDAVGDVLGVVLLVLPVIMKFCGRFESYPRVRKGLGRSGWIAGRSQFSTGSLPFVSFNCQWKRGLINDVGLDVSFSR